MAHGSIAFVKEQGVEFGVYQAWTMQLRRPVALMGADRHHVYGHKSIVDFVSSVHPSCLPWQNVG
jgi:hypothetical protein